MKNKIVHLLCLNAAAFGMFIGSMSMTSVVHADELAWETIISSSSSAQTETPAGSGAESVSSSEEQTSAPQEEQQEETTPTPSVSEPDSADESASGNESVNASSNSDSTSATSSNWEKDVPDDENWEKDTPITTTTTPSVSSDTKSTTTSSTSSCQKTENKNQTKTESEKKSNSHLIKDSIIYKEGEEGKDTNETAPVVKPGTGSRIVTEPKTVKDYRFWQIGKTKLFARADLNILDDKKDDAKVIGTAKRLDILYKIKDAGDGWTYVESGNARGFVKTSQLYSGKRADRIAHRLEEIGGAKTDEERALFDWSARLAKTTVPVTENKAYTWYRATTKQVVIKKKYAEPNDKVTDFLDVYESASADSRRVGKIPKDGFMYVIGDEDKPWVYIESGDVRGFVDKNLISDDENVTKEIETAGEDSREEAKLIVQPENNKAFYYTVTSVESGKPNGQIGKSLVSYASSFIGNPYVWGGTSLTDGADCSGFVQSIYKQYGITLPRVAEAQAQAGTAIPLKDAMPGDLLFYQDKTGYIYHVMIYAGNHKTVEAFNSDVGIISGTDSEGTLANWAVRVLDQTKEPEILDKNGATEIVPTQTVGGTYSYEKWNTKWTTGTYQKALYEQYENYDKEGFGKIGDRYVIACTTTFGHVGDLIDFELDDGTVIKTVMGDAKNQNDAGCNLYGHLNGENVIEFIVNGDTWYGKKANPGTSSNHPEWGGKRVVKAYNYGNILG